MLSEPADLDEQALAALLERHWRLRGVELEFLPIGFGSHHWRAAERFVTVDDLSAGFQAGPDADGSFAALDRAYRTAAALHDDAGLEVVVAPLRDDDGAVLRRLDERYAVSVQPWIDGQSGRGGPYETAEERRAVAEAVARVHAATAEVPAGLPRREDFAVPARPALEEALHDLERPWATGPFADPARQLLAGAAGGIEARLAEYDRLVAAAGEDGWMLTHGEPHSGNVIRIPDGARRLVDWDTVLVAPRERDLHQVLDDEELAEAGADPQLVRLYRLWWDLGDTAVFLHGFRRPHEHTAQTAAEWRVLSENLAGYR